MPAELETPTERTHSAPPDSPGRDEPSSPSARQLIPVARNPNEADRLAAGQQSSLKKFAAAPRHYPSVCHRLPAGAKVALTFGVVLIAVLTPPEFWPVHGVLGCLIFAGQTLANIPLRYLAHRLLVFLPPVVLLAISFPMSQGFQTGWSVSAAIVLRSTIALMAGLWMVRVLPFEELLLALRRYRVPMILVSTLAFAYRYLFVLWDELDRMRTARRARSFETPGLLLRWKTSVQLLGMLLLRALSRAERVHGAMCARGWDGQVRTLDDAPASVDGQRNT